MREIIINSKTHGRHVVMVDDEDFDELSKFKWHLSKRSNGKLNVQRSIWVGGRRCMLMHRQIMRPLKLFTVDHIDGNPLNNQKSNLRACTQSDNVKNRGIESRNKTGYKGVFFQKKLGKFRAMISIENKSKHIGCFTNKKEAAEAYNTEAIKYYGEFARLNQI